MVVTDTFRALIAELTESEVPDPLTRPTPLFVVWSDLCRLAGEPEPAEVAALLDAPAATPTPRGRAHRFVPAVGGR